MKKLEGLLVVDFTIALAGPFATQCLADHGARVIKIEAPNGDLMRTTYPKGQNGEPYYFDTTNRGKENACLNLKSAEDLAIVKEIIKRADLLVENFRPGVMDKLGLSYEAVKAINPRIVYASVSGFGHSGPNRDRACFDLVAQAYSGLMTTNGMPDIGPLRVGFSLADVSTAMWAYMAIMTALYARERTGQGDHIDVAMVDGLFAMQMAPVVTYTALNKEPSRTGNRSGVGAPFGSLPTQDGHLVVAVVGDKLWHAFCQGIGREELINDPRFARAEDRLANRQALSETLRAQFVTQTTAYWLAALEHAGVPSGPINSLQDICQSEQVSARRMLMEVDGIKVPANPMKFANEGDLPLQAHVASHGEHTDAIRAEFRPSEGATS